MKLLAVLLVSIISAVSAFPLTVKIGANEEECYYGQIHNVGSKIGFSYAVQAGGQFDIDLKIKSPRGQILFEETKRKQGEYSFSASETGEYEFCFSNDMSTFSEKTVEFDINIDSDVQATLPPQVAADTEVVERTINNIEDRTSTMSRLMGAYKTRNNRNESTVKSTSSRIFYFSIFELLLMVGMGALQVTIVQLFFKGSRKQLV